MNKLSTAHRIAFLCFILSLVFISAGAAFAESGSKPSGIIGNQITLHAPKQAWEVRRAEFWGLVKGVQAHDTKALKAFDAKLTDFEKQQFYRTPMENMDILGVFYVPKDGVKSALILATANAALGWYDALRFGSESGRAEIKQNEQFFLRAFAISDKKFVGELVDFIKLNPEQAASAVKLGLSFAENERVSPHYDTHWPTAYGLERIICAQGGSCEVPKEMPRDQWDDAWEKAKQQVAAYYAIPNK